MTNDLLRGRGVAFFALRLCVLFTFLCSAVATAQDTGDVARRLVGEGIEAARAQDWLTARDRFQRAYDIQPLPLTLYNLAAAQEKTGAYVEADRSYRIFLRETVVGEHDDFRSLALERRAALRNSICYVVINASNLASGDRLTVDEREIAHAVLGESIPTNPGNLTVKVQRQGQIIAQEVVTLSPGATQGVTFTLPLPQPSPPANVNNTTTNDTNASGSNPTQSAPPLADAKSNDTGSSTTAPTSTAQPDEREDEEGGSIILPVAVAGGIVAGIVVVAAAAAAGGVGGYYAYVTPAGSPTDSTITPLTLGAQ